MSSEVVRLPRVAWLVIASLVILANVPYVVGYLNAPEGGAFTGNAFAQTRVDYNSHLARLQHGLRGDWGLTLLFTPEAHPPRLVQPFYLTFGHLARVTGLSLVAVYHLARIGTMVLMWWSIWQFVARFLPDGRQHWWAFLLASIVGGLGWVLYLVLPTQTADLAPIEFWLLDAYTLLAALTFPHFCAAVAALVGYALLLDRWLNDPGWRLVGGLALLSVAVGLLQPFDLLLTALLTGFTASLFWLRGRLVFRQLLTLIPVAAIHMAIVAYYSWGFSSDPVWAAFTAQNITLSPPPIYYLFGYAWLLIPAGVGLVNVWRRRDERLIVPVAWMLVSGLLLYVPLTMQRRFLMGWQVPLAVLGAIGLETLRDTWLTRRGGMRRVGQWRLLLTLGFALASLTHLLFITSGTLLLTPEERPLLFLSEDDRAAQDWLREMDSEAVILSSFEAGGEIAGFTGQRVYIGHWIETMDFAARQAEVAAFFDSDGMSDAERRILLGGHGITHVWVDDTTRALGDWSPAGVDFLRPAFESPTVNVYEVVP